MLIAALFRYLDSMPFPQKVPVAAVLLIALLLPALASDPEDPARVVPGAEWDRIPKPESAGFSSGKLDALRTWLKTQVTTGVPLRSSILSSSQYGLTSPNAYK